MDIHSRHFKEILSRLKLKDHATWRNCCHFSCFTLEVQSCLTRNCLEPSWLGVGSLQLQFQMSAHCAASKACCFEITWEQCLATDCSDSELHILAAVFVLGDHFVEILLAIRSWDPTWWILGISSCTRSLETKMLQGCLPFAYRWGRSLVPEKGTKATVNLSLVLSINPMSASIIDKRGYSELNLALLVTPWAFLQCRNLELIKLMMIDCCSEKSLTSASPFQRDELFEKLVLMASIADFFSCLNSWKAKAKRWDRKALPIMLASVRPPCWISRNASDQAWAGTSQSTLLSTRPSYKGCCGETRGFQCDNMRFRRHH